MEGISDFPVINAVFGIFAGTLLALIVRRYPMVGYTAAVVCLTVIGLMWFLDKLPLRPENIIKFAQTYAAAGSGFLVGCTAYGIYVLGHIVGHRDGLREVNAESIRPAMAGNSGPVLLERLPAGDRIETIPTGTALASRSDRLRLTVDHSPSILPGDS
jgi:hypothetical protein